MCAKRTSAINLHAKLMAVVTINGLFNYFQVRKRSRNNLEKCTASDIRLAQHNGHDLKNHVLFP